MQALWIRISIKGVTDSDEDSLIYESREGVMENCPKCNQTSSHSAADFYWINPSELES